MYLIVKSREIRTTATSVRLKKQRLWQDGNTNEALQERLDAYIECVKKESIKILGSASILPKPMRCVFGDMKNVSLKLRFKFDTDYDNHDFSIGVRQKSL